MAFSREKATITLKSLLEAKFKIKENTSDNNGVIFEEITDDNYYLTFQIPKISNDYNFICHFILTAKFFDGENEDLVNHQKATHGKALEQTNNLQSVIDGKALKTVLKHNFESHEDLTEDSLKALVTQVVEFNQKILQDSHRSFFLERITPKRFTKEELVEKFEKSNDDSDKISLIGLKAGFITKFCFSDITFKMLNEPHGIEDLKIIIYKDSFGYTATYVLEEMFNLNELPKTWFDIWKILEYIIKDGEDFESNQLESLLPVEGRPGCYELLCRSD